jgi:hypothetical protein
MRKLILATVAALVVMLVGAPPAAAEETTCVGVLTGVHDNVVVPKGAFCELTGATVLGNVKALEGAILRMRFDTIGGNVTGTGAQEMSAHQVTVGGNYEGDKTEIVTCDTRCTIGGNFTAIEGVVDDPGFDARVGADTTVEGNVQLGKMVGDLLVFASTVHGNVQITESFIPPKPAAPFFGLDVRDSFIAGDLQVFKNRGPGPKVVAGNTVGQSIQCFENAPPFVGGPNTAPKKEGQCF